MTGTALAFPTPASLGSLDHYIQAVNRFPLLTAEQETRARPPAAPRQRPRRRAAARAVAPAAGRRGEPQVPGLRPPAGRPHPGRQHRPHEGRAPLRPGARRAPGFVRAALDPGRDPRIRPAQLAARQGRDDQGAAQALLQPAQHEDPLGRAVDRRKRTRSRRTSASSPRRSSRWRRASPGRDIALDPQPDEEGDAVTPIAYLTDTENEPVQILERAETETQPDRRPEARARQARRPQPPHHRGALAARRRSGDAAGPRRRVRRFGRAHPPDRGQGAEVDARRRWRA